MRSVEKREELNKIKDSEDQKKATEITVILLYNMCNPVQLVLHY